MKWAYQIRYKIKTATFLTGIMIVILLSNLWERSQFSDLDESMTSIYNDRLKPASYLYELSNLLHQKRLLHDRNVVYPKAELEHRVTESNGAIAGLIKAYETTVLTPEERTQWLLFRERLREYDFQEQQWLAAYGKNQEVADGMHSRIHQAFNLTLGNLNALNKIQVGEGTNLQRSSHSIVSNTLILSYLEIALLIILSLFTLVILSISDNRLFRQIEKQALN